jgi:hypothetical protein
MASVLDKSIASRLKTGLQATPAASKEVIEGFSRLLDELQQAGISEAEAENRMRQWIASAPVHGVTVLQSVILGSLYLRILSESSWVYKVFSGTIPSASK